MVKVTLESYWNASLADYKAILGDIIEQIYSPHMAQVVRKSPDQNDLRKQYRSHLTKEYLKRGMFDKATTAIVRHPKFEFMQTNDNLDQIINYILF